MKLSNNAGYVTALVSGEKVSEVTTLHQLIAGICRTLENQQVYAGSRVLILLKDDHSLLAALWALLNMGITGVVVNPATNKVSREDVADFGVDTIITDRLCFSHTTEKKIIYIEDIVPVTEHEVPQVFQLNELPLIIYEQAQNPVQISAARLNDIAGKLDQLLASAKVPGIFLSRNLPLSQFITELLWASSRGIPVVSGHPELTDMLKHTVSEQRFDMSFTLFYFGSYIESSDSGRYSLLFDSARFADANGFKAVWTPERHFNEFGGLYPNPSVMSAALAVSTSRVQIRSGSLVSPLHHPVRIAEDWALIDNLSGGRAGLSFASGWQCDDFVFFPDNYPDRHNVMLDQISKVRKFWKGEKLPFKNGLGKEVEISIFPKPVQASIPIWITVSGRVETFVDAGRIGANILTHLLWQDTDELIDKIAAYRKSLSENGFDPRSGTVTVMVHTHLGADNEQIRNKVREPLKNYIRTSTQLIQSMIKTNMEVSSSKELGGRYGTIDNEIPEQYMDELAEIAFNRFFEQAALLGTVEKGKSLLKKLKGYDVDEVACLIDFGLSKEEILHGLNYLKQLQDHYVKPPAHQPVSIIHCTPETLSDPVLADFLSTQNWILTDATADIDPSLSSRLRIISDDPQQDADTSFQISGPELATVNSSDNFNAVISEDFE